MCHSERETHALLGTSIVDQFVYDNKAAVHAILPSP